MLRKIVDSINKGREFVGRFPHILKEEQERLAGKAVSKARLIRSAFDIEQLSGQIIRGKGPHIARPIRGAVVRMLDGKPMIFFTDGSLRHMLGRKTTKAARKALKRATQARRRAVTA